jgi:hypothetical protein
MIPVTDLVPQHEQAWLDAMEHYIKEVLEIESQYRCADNLGAQSESTTPDEKSRGMPY